MRNRTIDHGLAVLFIGIALMQLVEFILWQVVDRCDDTNRAAGKLISLALVVQPLIALWAAWKFKMGWAGGYKQLFVAGLLLAPITLWDLYRRDVGRCVVVDANGHLAWPQYSYNSDGVSWLMQILYWGGLTFVIATLKNKILAALLAAAHVWTFYKSHILHGAWPSVYCHTVNALVVLAILLN